MFSLSSLSSSNVNVCEYKQLVFFLNMYLFMRHFLSSSKGNVVVFLCRCWCWCSTALPICVVSLMFCASHFIPFGCVISFFFSSIRFTMTSSSAGVCVCILFLHTNVFLSVYVCELWVHLNLFIVSPRLSCFSFRFVLRCFYKMFNLKRLAKNSGTASDQRLSRLIGITSNCII